MAVEPCRNECLGNMPGCCPSGQTREDRITFRIRHTQSVCRKQVGAQATYMEGIPNGKEATAIKTRACE
jgi:hypothetical protein